MEYVSACIYLVCVRASMLLWYLTWHWTPRSGLLGRVKTVPFEKDKVNLNLKRLNQIFITN